MSKPVSPSKDAAVTLREITEETVVTICKLKVKPEQEGFVASNALSIAQAHFDPDAWFRAIYAGETPVGFVMVDDDVQKKEYFLWRFMIDARYQGMGFGRKALLQVIEYVKTRPGAKEFYTSYVPGEGCPRDFYIALGFEETGEEEEGERVMRLTL